MTLTITLTASAGKGVNFNAYLTQHFNGFTPFQMPLFNNATGSSVTTQIVHLDTPIAGKEAQDRFVALGGTAFDYTMSNHSVSGTITSVSLGTLGAAWNAQAQDISLINGLLTTAAVRVKITGFHIANPLGVKGDVHEIVAGMMGGGPSGTEADAAPITSRIWAEAHRLIGSAAADSYTGTRFADTLAGNAGNDRINGAGGADKLTGGLGNDTLLGAAGNDTLDGGAGLDRLTGGTGADLFVFSSASQANRDRITDFGTATGDRIDLRLIDAQEGVAGNQAFKWMGSGAFTGQAGQLRFATTAGETRLQADTDGDRLADFQVFLTGKLALSAGDFLL